MVMCRQVMTETGSIPKCLLRRSFLSALGDATFDMSINLRLNQNWRM
jgi:hypothetical protein